ncbi:nickel pincer cofactor biosynthesis protein LarC [Dermatobacter hominis]|uniref:nickel pincer cofactor biosynthesis protein LarC n=1 Tax=Dermatobacter hominis TaxID=2884263 RepID=UPI001D0F78D1|nr:nickel pincer cofactor biosynthesis protein LarC [Dermatobacter hominis]UDY37720.1 nickel pincer cofactor biosynthesis protein LarC [Dermatobacter hominis]
MSALWVNPAVGVAGDMLLAALLDAGADPEAVRATVAELPVPGWSLDAGPTTRRGLTATSVVVTAPDGVHHRSWSTIDAMLAAADLPGPVRDGARATFERLARAEAHVHGIDVDEVHFHEVGAIDAIVDVVGTWAALHDLGDPRVTSAPVGLGIGTVRMAHGTVPVPAPATLELLEGHPTAPLTVDGRPVERETATPTGVALLTTMAAAWGPLPAGTIRGVGRGAGTWDPAGHANVVTVVRYEPADEAGADRWPAASVEAVVVETNVDDVTPEVLGHVISLALELGADDAWVLPVTMKKSRPGHQVRVLCRPALVPAVRRLLATETGTLGLREWAVTKHELERRTTKVLVDGHTVGIKVGPYGAKPEHDDVAAAARALDRPLRDVADEALAAFRARRSG